MVYRRTENRETPRLEINLVPSDPKYAKDYYDQQLSAQPAVYTRKCHDCGKPTNDYRCPKCWQKIRSRHGVSVETVDSSDTYEADFLRDDFDDID